MRIAIATDAWHPQVNGVVRTLTMTCEHLRREGHDVLVVHPGHFRSFPLPCYREINLAWPSAAAAGAIIEDFNPDAIHISTEATVGLSVRSHCLRSQRPFTTSYHTAFPDYAWRYLRLPRSWTYSYLRRFHAPARSVLVATATLEKELRSHGFRNRMCRWSRGVDTSLFRPLARSKDEVRRRERPVCLYVGRVAVEKNVEAFLKLSLPYDKVVVGDGPLLDTLRKRYHDAHFLGSLVGEQLAAVYRDADVLVFPSQTDTFGLVIIEALASGIPVAAFPAPGPIDILSGHDGVGCLSHDLREAIDTALQDGRHEACLELARQYNWRQCTEQSIKYLVLESHDLLAAA